MHRNMDRSLRATGTNQPPSLFAIPRRFPLRRISVAAGIGAAVLVIIWRYFVPITVERAVVRIGDIPITLSAPGLVEAKETMSVSARIQARIARIHVTDGDQVDIDDVLVELDQQDVREQLRQSNFDSQAAQAAVDEAEQKFASATSVLENARSELARKSALHNRRVISLAQIDAVKATFEQAQAQQQQAQAVINRSRSQLAAAQAAGRIIASRLSDGTVRAPRAGIVTTRDKSVGDILVPGQAVATIVDPTSLILSARFDESAMGAIKTGQTAEIRFTSQDDEIFRGRVIRLGRSVDPTTREFRVEISLDKLPNHWAIGQRAKATVRTALKNDVPLVPSAFIARSHGKSGMWIENGGRRAEWREIEIGAAYDGQSEVTRGLRGGEIIVTGSRLFQYARLAT